MKKIFAPKPAKIFFLHHKFASPLNKHPKIWNRRREQINVINEKQTERVALELTSSGARGRFSVFHRTKEFVQPLVLLISTSPKREFLSKHNWVVALLRVLAYHIRDGPCKVVYVLGTVLEEWSRLHVVDQRQLDNTHLHKLVPNIIHCDDVHYCDHECEELHHLLHCCADDGGMMEACDVVTFDLMESHRVEWSVPFDGYFVVLAKRMPALVALSLTVVQLHPSDEHNCCWQNLMYCYLIVKSLVMSRCSKAVSLARTLPGEPS